MNVIKIFSIALVCAIIGSFTILPRSAQAECPCWTVESIDENPRVFSDGKVWCIDNYEGRNGYNDTMLLDYSIFPSPFAAWAIFDESEGIGYCDFYDVTTGADIERNLMKFGEYQACRRHLLKSEMWFLNCGP
jgi:hypothetical protein